MVRPKHVYTNCLLLNNNGGIDAPKQVRGLHLFTHLNNRNYGKAIICNRWLQNMGNDI